MEFFIMNIPYDYLKKLCENNKINLMVLFGSYASENFNEKSDIDLAINSDNINFIRNNKTELLYKISRKLNYKNIDIVILNHANPLLKFNIARNGKLIYEKQKGLFNKFKVRAMKENNDAKKFYQLDKKYIENYISGRNKNGKQRINPPQIK